MELTTRNLTATEQDRNKMLVSHYSEMLKKELPYTHRNLIRWYLNVAKTELKLGITITIQK